MRKISTKTKAEVTKMYDEQKGYADRKNHIYDKYYRYGRNDNGAAYDRGVVKCVNEAETFSKEWKLKDEENFQIIEIAKEHQF